MKTLKIVDVKVWVRDSPEYPIEGFEGATESMGHFETEKAVLLEGLVAQIKQNRDNAERNYEEYGNQIAKIVLDDMNWVLGLLSGEKK